MTTKNPTRLLKDMPNKKITVTRLFDAAPELVWRAWTEKELLDQWWAPKPWRAETQTMDFREGGHWFYAMVGPDNTRNWVRFDYGKIDLYKNFHATDSFCDEHGNPTHEFPGMNWKNEFHADGAGTKVVVEIKFNSEADLQKIIELGFEAGFTAALSNLEHYLSTQFKIRKELKTNNMARVATYLNFPGKTEEAFNFYKKVFHGEFSGVGVGLRRFGDIEMPPGMPPMSEADKKLIIHAELTIMAGHVLMATDSPESMGFEMKHGNNMHINLEPESKEETKRLFDALSEGGNISMPLSDMFWGAYFASFTDKYGINWMLNFQARD
ncbi:MAG: activator of Hsp90 ATPase 1 family protein [Bacteroidetes bacterium]|nr:MAG: activator of Hsp90 ATPase 1 family protein [Bacteroidota bacterium]